MIWSMLEGTTETNMIFIAQTNGKHTEHACLTCAVYFHSDILCDILFQESCSTDNHNAVKVLLCVFLQAEYRAKYFLMVCTDVFQNLVKSSMEQM